MLGFRGHFATKSRRYSTTLGRLRSARRNWQKLAAVARTRGPGDGAEETDDLKESTLVIGQWGFTGMGWLTSGDAYLAAQAAAAAREWEDEKYQESSSANNKKR